MQMDTIYRRFGLAVKKRREEMNLTQDDLAKRVELSRGSIANIEAGRQKVLLHHVFMLARFLNVDPSDLIYSSRPPSPESGLFESALDQVPADSHDFVTGVLRRAKHA